MKLARDVRGEGMAGNAILWIPRILLIILIAGVVLGISATSYGHYIDVRDAEAQIMFGSITACLVDSGFINLDLISEEESHSILSHCGFDETEVDRFFVRAQLFDLDGDLVKELSHGDSGLVWVSDIFEESKVTEKLQKYRPGFFESDLLEVLIIQGGEELAGDLKIGVVVNHEF